MSKAIFKNPSFKSNDIMHKYHFTLSFSWKSINQILRNLSDISWGNLKIFTGKFFDNFSPAAHLLLQPLHNLAWRSIHQFRFHEFFSTLFMRPLELKLMLCTRSLAGASGIIPRFFKPWILACARENKVWTLISN